MRDYDLSPYASPRAASPELSFPLTCFAGGPGSSHPVSESASGTITPAFSSGEDASPRAVLRGASALLLGEQQAVGPAVEGQAAGPPPLQRKSLLSSSLAATGRGGSASPEQQQQGPSSGGKVAAPPVPEPQAGGGATIRHHRGGSVSYRVSNEWQQPAIRTVKMQGQAPAPSPADAVCNK